MECTCEIVGLVAGGLGLALGVTMILSLLFYIKATSGLGVEPQKKKDAYGRDL